VPFLIASASAMKCFLLMVLEPAFLENQLNCADG